MKIKRILAIVLIATIIFGIVLLIIRCNADKDFTKNVTLTENGVTHSELEFSVSGLKPGDSSEYVINLRSAANGTYETELVFSERRNGGLRSHITVTLTYRDVQKEYSLDELFEGETVKFDCEIGNSPAEIRIVFAMPKEVENDAQGTYSDFIIDLNAQRK